MTITTQRLLDELGNRAWSGFNKDDMVFGEEESLRALSELNSAHRYLMSKEDFPFLSTTEELETERDENRYSMVNGQIEYISFEDGTTLDFVKDTTKILESQNGKPSKFWLNYTNPEAEIILYPIPDKVYKLNIKYNTYCYILSQDGESLFEFEKADDYLNLPSYLAYLYMDCLILRTMITNNKDIQDENYQPMINEFNEAWINFKRRAKPLLKHDTRVVI